MSNNHNKKLLFILFLFFSPLPIPNLNFQKRPLNFWVGDDDITCLESFNFLKHTRNHLLFVVVGLVLGRQKNQNKTKEKKSPQIFEN